jgi:DNA-binding beta-propeller fold protein YncE
MRKGGNAVIPPARHPSRPVRPRALGLSRVCALGCVALALTFAARAGTPRGGEVLLIDRQNIAMAGHPVIFGVDPVLHATHDLAYPAELNSPRAIAWGVGKRLYAGDGARIWEIDSYQPGSTSPDEITDPRLQFVIDLAQDGAGDLYVLDQLADPLGEGYSGALFHLDASSREFEMIFSDPRFVSPRRMLIEADGRLLVLDPRGRMRWSAPRNGALYRIDPEAHRMQSLLSLHLMQAPAAIALQDPDTLLLVDSDLSYPGLPAGGGGIVRISLADFTIVDTLALPEFVQPADIVVLPGGQALVLDEQANPNEYADARGALFQIDLRTGELIATIARATFRSLTAIDLFDSPDMDQSRMQFSDTNMSGLRAGDVLRFQGTLVSSGPVPPGTITFDLELGGLDCLLGTVTIEKGAFAYDPLRRIFRWTGSLAYNEETDLAVDLKVPVNAAAGSDLEVTQHLWGDLVDRRQTFLWNTAASPVPGVTVYVDADRENYPAPRLFTLGEDSYTPQTLLYDPGNLLPAPADVVYGNDGTLYILDVDALAPKVLAVDPLLADTTVIYQGPPLTLYARALALAHDGSLLIVDPKASDAIPGVIYRLDPATREIGLFFTTSDADSFPNPVDICPDRNGHYLVCETNFVTGGYPSGGVFELDEDGSLVTIHTVAGRLVDPYSAVVDRDGTAYVVDRADNYPGGPSLYWMVRQDGGPTQFYRMSTGGSEVLVKPCGITRLSDTEFAICDRESNRLNPGRGGLFKFVKTAPGAGHLTMQSLHADLRRPIRADAFQPPQLVCSSLELQDITGGQLQPGDIVQAAVELTNKATTPGLGVAATIHYSSRLILLYQSASRGSVRANGDYGAVEWSGDLRFLDPVTLTLGFRVAQLAMQGEEAEIRVDMVGGVAPQPVTASMRIAGPLQGNEILVLDSYAHVINPLHHGTLFTADPATLSLDPFRSHTAFVRPVDVYAVSADRILVLDRDADPIQLGQDTGALFELNTRTNTLRPICAGSQLVDPQRLVACPQGGWYLLDSDTPIYAGQSKGAIFRVPAEGGAPVLVAASTAFRALSDLAVGPDGTLWVVDREANPNALPIDDTGAIFAVDPVSGEVTATYASEALVDPQGVLWVDGRGLLVTDPSHFENGFTGIRRLDPASGDLTYVIASPFLVTPTRMLKLSNDQILIADSTATPPGASLRGAVFLASLGPSQLGDFMQHPDAQRIAALSMVPPTVTSITRFEEIGAHARGYRAPGDTLRCRIVVRNLSQVEQPLAVLSMRAPPTLRLDPLSGSASGGFLAVVPESLRWEGAIAALDSVSITYAGNAGLIPGVAPWIDQIAKLQVAFGLSNADSLSIYVSSATADGELIVTDAWAQGRPGTAGAILRGELQTRAMVPVLASREFVAPVAVTLVPGSATDLLIVDASVRTGGGGVGALFRGSTRTGKVERIFAHSTLRQPMGVAAADSFTAFLLDADADPLGLRPSGEGPGAIYRIDLQTGAGEVLASDTRFWEPRDIVVDPTTGALIVVDAGNDTPTYPGSVYRVDPVTGTVTVIASGGVFVSPRCAVVDPAGRVYVMDYRGEQLGGAVYAIDPGVSPGLYALCPSLRDPYRLLIDNEQRILCVDTQANPAGYPGQTGSILRLVGGGSTCWLYASGPPFVRPSGMTARFDGTPVALVALDIFDTERGVDLRWVAPDDLRGAGFFVYRRSAEAATSRFEPLNAQSPVTGVGELHYLDATAAAGELYEYLLVALLPDGTRQEYGPLSIRASGTQLKFFLGRPLPNPFHPSESGRGLTLRFGLPEPGGPVRLTLVDVCGRRLVDLLDARARPGLQSLEWNGRDGGGARLESGVYFLRLEMGARVARQRLVLLR